MDTPELAARFHKRRSRTIAVTERLVRGFLRPYAGLIALAMLANVVVAASTGALPWLIQQVVDLVFVANDADWLLIIPFAIVAITLIRVAALLVNNFILAFVGQRAMTHLQQDLVRNLVHSDIASVQQKHSGDYLAIFMTDVVRVRDNIINTVVTLARNILSVIALTLFMYSINMTMAIIYTLIVIPAAFFMMRRLGKRTRQSSRQGLEETGLLSSYLSEMLQGLRIVKAYGQEERQIARTFQVIEKILYHTMRSIRARATASPVVELLTGLAIGVIAYLAGQQSLAGNFTAGTFMGFITALMASYQPLRSVATLQTSMQEGVSAALRIFAVLDRPRAHEEKNDTPDLVVREGHIIFENVRYKFEGRNSPALDSASLEVASGETIALVGTSGSGKSSLVNALLRFFDIQGGRILIDGQDISTVSIASLRRTMGLVTQEPFLFDDTIAANIAYGKPDASRTEIEAAAQTAGIHDFISTLPDAYETRTGESGVRLSGGQKQRLAIARAVLRDPPILLLDEATSALDTATEIQVQKSLTNLMRGRSALVIAHRLSTIIAADRIYLMEAGRVIESGTHKELLAQAGAYAELYQKQFAREA